MFREIFSGANGELSSKRIFGALGFFFSIVFTFWIIIIEGETAILMYPYSLTAGLFGFGTFEKKKK